MKRPEYHRPSRSPDLRARIVFLDSEEGGRSQPVFSGYRPNHDFGLPGELNDALHEYPESGRVLPGESAEALLWFLVPERLEARLESGARFSVQEANRVVGHGEIIAILNEALRRRGERSASDLPAGGRHAGQLRGQPLSFSKRFISSWQKLWPSGRPQSVRLELHVEREEGEADLLLPQLIVDGERLAAFDHGPIDLVELERSLAEDGTYFLWTCTCGEPGCGGRLRGVRVTRSRGLVRWRCLDTGRRFQLKATDLAEALEVVRAEGRQMLEELLGLQTAPEQNRSFFRNSGESP